MKVKQYRGVGRKGGGEGEALAGGGEGYNERRKMCFLVVRISDCNAR